MSVYKTFITISLLISISFTAAILSPVDAVSSPLDKYPSISSAHQQVSISDAMDVIKDYRESLRKIEENFAPIKSKRQLMAYIQHHPKDSVLLYLPKFSREMFINSLTFNNKGLTSFNYSALASTLTATQAYKILSLFGMQGMTSQIAGLRVVSVLDKEIMYTKFICGCRDKKCGGHSTCVAAKGYICGNFCN